MNRPSQVIRPRLTSQTPAVGEKGGEAYTRSVGRNFIMALYGSVRSIRMYPIENPVVQKGLEELTLVTEELRDAEGDLEFRVSGEFIFVNSTRLRLDLDNYTTFSYLLALCRACGVGQYRTEIYDLANLDIFVIIIEYIGVQRSGTTGEGRFEARLIRPDFFRGEAVIN